MGDRVVAGGPGAKDVVAMRYYKAWMAWTRFHKCRYVFYETFDDRTIYLGDQFRIHIHSSNTIMLVSPTDSRLTGSGGSTVSAPGKSCGMLVYC